MDLRERRYKIKGMASTEWATAGPAHNDTQCMCKAIKGPVGPILRSAPGMPMGHATVRDVTCHATSLLRSTPTIWGAKFRLIDCLFDHSAGTIWSTNFRLAAYLTIMLSWNTSCWSTIHEAAAGQQLALAPHQRQQQVPLHLALVPRQRQQVPLHHALIRRHGGGASTPHARVLGSRQSGTYLRDNGHRSGSQSRVPALAISQQAWHPPKDPSFHAPARTRGTTGKGRRRATPAACRTSPRCRLSPASCRSQPCPMPPWPMPLRASFTAGVV